MSTSARLILGLAMSLIAPATTPGSPPPAVVVAELFTSGAPLFVRAVHQAANGLQRSRVSIECHLHATARGRWRTPVRGQAPLGDDHEHVGDAATLDSRRHIDADRHAELRPVAPNWDVGQLRIVGVIQERDSRRILGAGAAETSFRPGSDR